MLKLTTSQDISDFLATANKEEARFRLEISSTAEIDEVLVDWTPETYAYNDGGKLMATDALNIPSSWLANNSSLSVLVIGGSVTSIGSYAFNNCSGFTGALTIPSSVTNIGNYAFYNCTGFTGALTIPSSVTSIGSSAFRYCTGFTALTIPSSVTSIGSYAFQSCYGFTGALTIPSSVTSIGSYAFQSCSGFTGTLTIPSSVTSIGNYAFYNCSGFTLLKCYANPAPALGGSFSGLSVANISVPVGATGYDAIWGGLTVIYDL